MSSSDIQIKNTPFNANHVSELIRAKHFDAAEQLIKKELDKSPKGYLPLFLMGFLLLKRGNNEEAKTFLEEAWANAPQLAARQETALTLSGIYFSLNEPESAIQVVEASLEGDYASKQTLVRHLTARLVNLCTKTRDLDRLRKIQAKLLPHKYDDIDMLRMVCLNFQTLGEMDKAILLATSGVQQYPHIAALVFNFYNSLGEFGKSEPFLKQGLERIPNNADLNVALANIYAYQGKEDKAKALLQVLDNANNADNPLRVKCVLGTFYLKEGDFKQGHLLMESRYDDPTCGGKNRLLERIDFTLPLPESGNIYISQEEGVGDQIRYAKYLSMLDKEMAERVIINCDARLVPLFEESFPELKFVAWGDANLEYMKKHQITRQILHGSTYLLADKPMTLAEKGYLKTGNIAETRDPAKPIKIGLCWRSVRVQAARVQWYMPLQEVAALFADIDCELVSLQNDVTEQELATIREYSGKELQVTDVDAKDDFLGLARLMEGLDLVISTTTATCELAGATGQETWVLANAHPDRWYLSQKYLSHFYPKLKMYMKQGPEDWSDLASGVRRDLLAFVSQSEC